MKRSGFLRRRTPLRSGWLTTPAGPDPVYEAVDRRAMGRCEVTFTNLASVRCSNPARDHHHTRKPRKTWNHPDYVMAICRACHERVDWPYLRGRLEILPLGAGRFACAIVTAPDKWAARAMAK